MKQVTICVLGLVLMSRPAGAQEFAVDKGAAILSGTIGFSSQGGDLYESNGARATTFLVTPSFSYFAASNFFIGGSLEFSLQDQGDFSSTSLAFGPHLGIAGGKPESTTFPYFGIGVRYMSVDVSFGNGPFGYSQTLSGTDIAFGPGVIVALRKHLGMIIDASFHITTLGTNGVSQSGNMFAVSVGFAGLLFREE